MRDPDSSWPSDPGNLSPRVPRREVMAARWSTLLFLVVFWLAVFAACWWLTA